MKADALPLSYQVILDWVRPDSSVLDLGCGDGELMELLVRGRQSRVQGIEIDEKAIYACVARGLSVFHEDIDNGLTGYGDRSFDYVILNESLQQVRRLDSVLQESLRVGRQAIVGFPNFAHYRARCQIFFRGKTPITPALPYEWHDSPNLHFLSILDFIAYCRQRGIKIDESVCLSGSRKKALLTNLFARTGLFLISK